MSGGANGPAAAAARNDQMGQGGMTGHAPFTVHPQPHAPTIQPAPDGRGFGECAAPLRSHRVCCGSATG